MFNHAIVYVKTERPFWIDATASETRVGFLPPADQGRLALIANRQTTALVKTPEEPSKDNWQRHTVAVRMTEFGPGQITETVEASGGSTEPQLRARFAGDADKVKEQLDIYVKGMFAAKSAGHFEVTGRDAMNGPFRLLVEAQHSALVQTGLDDSGVALAPWLVFDQIPFSVRGVGELSDDADSTGEKKKRVHDFVLPEAFVSEYHYAITPPSFFKVSSLPASAELKLGPATFSRSYKSNPDGTLEAIFRLDTGKRRLTADEFIALRDGVKEQAKRVPEVIAFLPETSEYMATGQTGKALALIRESVTRHPDNAMAHVRLSHLLLAGAVGGAALTEAKRATELDPKSSVAWQTLGWAYQHDTFGRRMKGSWNFVEAEKCYRQAIELDPDDTLARTDLAILLEHNADGWRYGKDARLEEAAALYRQVLKKQPNPPLEQNLAVALLRTGQVAAAKEEARKCPADFQTAFLAVITAIQEGPARAIMSAQSTFPDPQQRAMHLFGVAATLLQIRRYDVATLVMNAAARLANMSELQTRAELFGKLKRWEDQVLPENDPAAPLQRLMLEALRGKLTLDILKQVCSKRMDASKLDSGFETLQSSVWHGQNDLSFAGLPQEVTVDWVLSLTSFEKAGEAINGFRIRALTPGGARIPAVYVVPEDGRYRLLGMAPNSLEAIGKLVLELVEKNSIPQAQWWLDRVVGDAEAGSDGTGLPAVRGLWSGVTAELRGASTIRTAVASLFGSSTGAPKAIQILESTRVRAATALEKSQIDKALCEVLRRVSKWDDLLPVAKRLESSKLFSEEGFRYVVAAAAGAKRWKDLELEAQQRLVANPLNTAAMQALVLARLRQGNVPGAIEAMGKMKSSRVVVKVNQGAAGNQVLASTDDYIFAAWTTMLSGKASQDALVELRKAKEGASSDLGYQYTLATMQALTKSPDDAAQSLLQAINRQDYFHLTQTAWVAYGLICKQYGFPEEAENAFARARKVVSSSDELGDWALELIPVGAPGG